MSDAIWDTTLPPFATLSTVITGKFELFAIITDAIAESESTGFKSTISTSLTVKSSMFDTSFAGSFWESKTTTSYPNSFALFSIPDFKSTKNGLFNVDTIKPIFCIPSSFGLHPTNKLDANIVVIIIERNFFILFPPTCFFYLKVQLLI